MHEKSNLPGPAIGEIVSTIGRRDKALGLMNEALDKIAEAQAIAPPYSFEQVLGNGVSWYADSHKENKNRIRKALDRRCWNLLIEKTKLGAVMNTKQLSQIQQDIEKQAPELTLNRAMTTFMDHYEKRGSTFKAGLVDVFKSLTGNYKSHSPFKIQNRLILNGALSANGWAFSSARRDQFNDLCRYLCLMEGIDWTQIPYDKRPDNIISQDRIGGEGVFKFDHFKVVTYLNGNIHVWLRPDLIKKVNQQIADFYGEALPG